METPYLFLCDFDQTLFDTKKPSPNGIGLEEGYEHAVLETFGPLGSAIYRQEGRLQNRAPSEVVTSLVRQDNRLISHARERHAELTKSSQKIPATLSILWKEADLVPILTEMLVHFKLQLFLGEIGTGWPLPYPGVCKFFETVANMALREKLPVQIGVLSSGHTSFIELTFCRWAIPYPRIMVTDDHVRPLKYPKDPEQKVKPAPFPFHLLQSRWLKKINGNSPISLEQLQASLSRIIYIGDDPVKDGGLAKNVGIPFGWFRENGKSTPEVSMEPFPKGSFSFSDWSALSDFLRWNPVKKMFLSGMPLAEIFAQF